MTRDPEARLRVALLSTSGTSSHGSMRAYADTLQQALSRHAPQVRTELMELAPESATGQLAKRWEAISLPWDVWRKRKYRPHIWHVLDGSRAYCAGLAGARPLVVTVHDVIPWLQDSGRFPQAGRLGLAARALWRANGWTFQRAGALACVSRSTALDVFKSWPVNQDRCKVVPLPLRPAMAARTCFTGRVAREKGFVLHIGNAGFYKNREGVLRIFARCDAALAARLTMAGPAPSAALLRLVGELGIEGRVEWVHDPSDEMLSQLYQRASVLLYPSHYEGFGWPPLEAMAFGLPVVASREGSLPEVAGAASAKRASTDEEGLAAELQILLSCPEAWSNSARVGEQQAQAFGEERFANEMHEIYRMALIQASGVERK